VRDDGARIVLSGPEGLLAEDFQVNPAEQKVGEYGIIFTSFVRLVNQKPLNLKTIRNDLTTVAQGSYTLWVRRLVFCSTGS